MRRGRHFDVVCGKASVFALLLPKLYFSRAAWICCGHISGPVINTASTSVFLDCPRRIGQT